MGLDMTFYKLHKKHSINKCFKKGAEVAYFRKANQIQNWLSHNMKDYQDNGEGIITHDEINDLIFRCEDVLAKRDTKYSKNHLPTTCGFFFGSTDYDEWYYSDVESAVEQFKEIIDNWNDNYVIVYSESY